jgi:ABC-2 type transport system permease protein
MWRLLGMRLRRDRIILPIWIVATALLALSSAKGVQVEAPTDAARAGVLKLAVATPSLLALRGVPDGPTLGSYVYFQAFCYLAVMAGLMTTFFVVRHTRSDEERGRTELIGSTPVGRLAPLAATLAVGLVANLVLGVAVALGFVAGGLAPAGSWAGGLATAAVGVAFLGLTAFIAQIAPTSRSANGIAGGAVGIAFFLRAVGDAVGTPRADGLSVTSAWPSWLSPIGWGQQVFAFTQANLAPLLLSVAFAVVTGGAAIALQARRDVGSSILRERAGSATGRTRSSFALAWRLQRQGIAWWTIGGALLGALAGSLAGRLASAANVVGSIQQIMASYLPGGRGQLTDLLVVAIFGIAGVLAAAASAQSILRARGEESDGRAELVLSTPVGRVCWLADYVIIAFIAALAVCLGTALVAALTFMSAGGPSDRVASSFAAGAAQLPAAVAFIAITAVLFVFLPRLTVPLTWGLLAVGLLIGQFGGLLQLPESVRDISPFTHTPAVPADNPDWSGAIVVVAVAVALLVISGLAMRRRQLTP